ncbi:hypothetical protein SteCoe_12407 [Stentor coeruleus]|uniref:DNA/RNA-binding protein Alba-like domain-containing protein n=1 Tax=Stentor coeruleus TaxID=5963 RepID=A0A1R2CAW2_9CILI|nr:hypothetical protein SteCoe_12407 [Stentor coeruleus]
MSSEEVMVAQNQGIGQKITQVAILLQTQREATITAINLAIPAAINLVEIIKHRVKGLYQVNSFERVPDSNKTRMKIKLSFNPLNPADKGYQEPIPENQVNEKTLDELKKPPQRTFTSGEENKRPEYTDRPARRRGGRRPRGGETMPRSDEKEHQEEEKTRWPRGNRRSRRSRRGGRNDRDDGGVRNDRGDRGGRSGRGGRGGRGNRGGRGDRGDRDYQGDTQRYNRRTRPRRGPPRDGLAPESEAKAPAVITTSGWDAI